MHDYFDALYPISWISISEKDLASLCDGKRTANFQGNSSIIVPAVLIGRLIITASSDGCGT